MDILSGAFLVRQLPPWYENISKRLVKSPKVYIHDTGILHSLLRLRSKSDLQSHPKLSFSWESFALEQLLLITGLDRDAYFYKTYAGAELDLLLFKNNRRYGFEFKYQDAPRPTRSMHTIIQELNLERLWIICPGERSYPLRSNIDVLSISDINKVLRSNGLIED